MSITTRVSLLLALSLFIATSAAGQATTSELVGVVRHEGTALQGATVSIKSPSLQGTRVAVTNENGYFNFGAIPPGSYEVTFELDGMATVVKTMRVGLARTERVDAVMKLLAVKASVTVTAAPPTVAETTEIQANVTAEEADSLPILRTIQSMALIAPGVTDNGPLKQITISGAPSYESLYLVDGAVVNENLRGQAESLYIEDAVEEETVMLSSVSAEYGRFTGGVVSVITKSGGNELSGTLRDSLTNPSWTNPSSFGEERAESNLADAWEATLGGRIVRDRLWFFLAGRYAESTATGFYAGSTIPRPDSVSTDERFEVKLTGQLNPKHSLTGSYLSSNLLQDDWCYVACLEESNLDENRELPRSFATLNYIGMMMNNLLIEVGWSTRDIRFVNFGGENHDQVLGTWGKDWVATGAYFGAPLFCGDCDDAEESRANDYYRLKGSYYLATGLGTHNISAGGEQFIEKRYANNYQSASEFNVDIINIAPKRDANGNLLVTIVGSESSAIGMGDFITWWLMPELSQGTEWKSDAVYVNDKWDVNSKISLNLGLRYDRNSGVDSSGRETADDSGFSPRLGAIFDPRGDGRVRLNASYSKYASRIQEIFGDSGSNAGIPVSIYYEYRGPTIGPLPTFDAFRLLFDWFNAQGGTDATYLIAGIGTGNMTEIREPLDSMNLEEWTVGLATQIGSRGYVRADYIMREWNDFYALTTTPGDVAENEFGIPFDAQVLTNNSENVSRSWEGVIVQARYRVTDRLGVAGNYTWSETYGNYVGESASSGAVPAPHTMLYYGEYHDYPRYNPEGWLDSDQRHMLRVWLEYEQPLGRFGSLTFGLLERYDSGQPYSAVANINVRPYVANPGYLTPPAKAPYYFSERGEYRWEDATATNLAVSWEVPIRKATMFAEAEVLNLFDEQAQDSGNTAIRVIRNFNPWTETPVEGVHWAKQATFGTAMSKSDYQTPLTYRFSAGVRF